MIEDELEAEKIKKMHDPFIKYLVENRSILHTKKLIEIYDDWFQKYMNEHYL